MLDRLLLLFDKYPLDFITHFSSSLPVLVGIFRYRYLSLASKLIILFFLFFLVKEAYATWLAVLRENNYYLQNIETLAETWIILAVALSCFKAPSLRRLIVVLAVTCSLIGFITYQHDAISSIGLSSFRLFSIFFCLAYFNKILIDIRVKNILLHTLFWFSTGLLIYSAGTFFIVLFSEYWYKDINKVPAEVFDKYWNIGQVLFIFFALLAAVGLWTSKFDRENTL